MQTFKLRHREFALLAWSESFSCNLTVQFDGSRENNGSKRVKISFSVELIKRNGFAVNFGV